MNDARVVRARLHLMRKTGGHIEILLLDPVAPSHDPTITLGAEGECCWYCMVGGLKKMRGGGEASAEFTVGSKLGQLVATLDSESPSGAIIRFRWDPSSLCFSEVLEAVGRIPLPPYIKRDDEPDDAESYQTVYAQHEGAVAAPTAGLHFTSSLLRTLGKKGIERLQLTLHVGAGTFAPVKATEAQHHQMHDEKVSISAECLQALIGYAKLREEEDLPFIHVGTTTLRTFESLYWFGVKLWHEGKGSKYQAFRVDQWDAWMLKGGGKPLLMLSEALEIVEEWRVQGGFSGIFGTTQLMILPGYSIQTCDGLITNFHQPKSTLILLVSAFLGGDLWQDVYSEALKKGYRFLSYGDSSLLIRSRFPH